jgi:hypothetical protein
MDFVSIMVDLTTIMAVSLTKEQENGALFSIVTESAVALQV